MYKCLKNLISTVSGNTFQIVERSKIMSVQNRPRRGRHEAAEAKALHLQTNIV